MEHLPETDRSYSSEELERLAATAATLCRAPVSVVIEEGRVVAQYPPGADVQEEFASSATEAWPEADGAISVYDRIPRDWTEHERLTLRMLARQAAMGQRNRDLAETARIAAVGKWRSEVQTGELRWSPMVFEIFGMRPGTTIAYSDFLAAVHPDDRAHAAALHQRALQGDALHWEHRVIPRTGACDGCWSGES